jgi:hypothetical protein
VSNTNTDKTYNVTSSENDKYVYNPNLESDVNSSVYVPGSDSEKNDGDFEEEYNEEHTQENTEEGA